MMGKQWIGEREGPVNNGDAWEQQGSQHIVSRRHVSRLTFVYEGPKIARFSMWSTRCASLVPCSLLSPVRVWSHAVPSAMEARRLRSIRPSVTRRHRPSPLPRSPLVQPTPRRRPEHSHGRPAF